MITIYVKMLFTASFALAQLLCVIICFCKSTSAIYDKNSAYVLWIAGLFVYSDAVISNLNRLTELLNLLATTHTSGVLP